MSTKLCQKCQQKFKPFIVIDSKRHNLQRRLFCLNCSPFKKHNTIDLNNPNAGGYSRINGKHQPYKNWNKQRQDLLMASLKRRRQKRKLSLVKTLGNQCSICGYDKNFSALHFHHTDPKQKSFSLSCRELAAYSLTKLQTEADKCVLLCANCHAEHHNPDCQMGGPTQN